MRVAFGMGSEMGVRVTWCEQQKVDCETQEEVYDLLNDLNEQELDSSRVWAHQWQRPGRAELARLEKVFGE